VGRARLSRDAQQPAVRHSGSGDLSRRLTGTPSGNAVRSSAPRVTRITAQSSAPVESPRPSRSRVVRQETLDRVPPPAPAPILAQLRPPEPEPYPDPPVVEQVAPRANPRQRARFFSGSMGPVPPMPVEAQRPANTVVSWQRLDSLLRSLSDSDARSPFPIQLALELDELLIAALENQSLAQAMEESLLEAQRSSPYSSQPRPVKTISHIVSTEEVRDQKECSICLNRFSCDEPDVVGIRCGHIFHSHCLNPWIRCHDTCPVCRTQVGG
jgi:hypothetical protein